MTKEQAINAMLDGHKIHHQNDIDGEYLRINGSYYEYFDGHHTLTLSPNEWPWAAHLTEDFEIVNF